MPKRKATWALIIWTALMLVWLIAGAGGAADECAETTRTQLEEDACTADAGIGAFLIIVIWFLGYIPLGVLWIVSRPKGRECPACGELVKRGRVRCEACGFDLAAAARGAGQPAAGGGAR